MLPRSTTRLIILMMMMMYTLVAYSSGSIQSNTTSLDTASDGTKLNGIKRNTERDIVTKANDTNDTVYNWRGLGHIMRDKRLDRLGNRRERRAIKSAGYIPTVPDSFRNYFRPCSSIANFIVLNIIDPHHSLLMKQIENVTVCLLNIGHMSMSDINYCIENLPGDFALTWISELAGFIFYCSLIVVIGIAMLVLLPLLVLRHIGLSRQTVVLEKLDGFKNSTWATFTVLSAVAMLFAELGIITVGSAGIEVGKYLTCGQTSRIFYTYEMNQAIVLKTINPDVRRRCHALYDNLQTLEINYETQLSLTTVRCFARFLYDISFYL